MNLNDLKGDDEILNSLKEKYTPEELRKLLAWYNAFDDTEDLGEDNILEVEDKVWDKLQQSTAFADEIEDEPIGLSRKLFNAWSLIGLAASIILVVGWLFIGKHHGDSVQKQFTTLREVSKADLPLWHTFSNTSKAIYELNLPDGSKVWLNPSTTISYKILANAPTRDIFLEGEAFFDVKPNKEQPFHVKNRGLNVVVLGTSFNVIASEKDDKYEVSVVTGKVKVKYQDPEHSDRFNQVIITPQQEVIIRKQENTLETHDLSLEHSAHRQLWEPISIGFDEVPIGKVLAKLEQEYGVTIRTPNASIRKCTLFANFNNQRLPVILDILCSSINATYQIDGQEITIIGEGCL
jgi:ferric-dicitrate binding protein FerR (iron transport regulator)